ncbi:MAG: transglycosylase domain-containing protein [Balneolaceae bacterium]|nr:transglycosylase domain-containing protein [Balneolaceae bacterium]MDR9408837.1 transglycosylase domain-containing protein [Balneolaceae bacterium]
MDNNNNIDMDRYFNDREYRKKISAQRNKKKSFRDLLSKKVVKIGLITFSVLFIALFGYVYYLFQGLPSIQELENPKTAIASEVRSRDGVVLDRYFVENRTYVSIDNISPHAIDALIATEDHRFFNHWGVDFQSLMRLPYYWLQQRFEGGSTISQQLARNLYRKIGFEVTVTRKLREMITAVQIESNYTKREIIEMYLNTVEFSNSAFGIESAAQTHYGKPAIDLTLSESANLIGQLQAVYAYNPRLFPERAKTRRNIVLGQMQKHGFLTEEIFINLSEEPIALNYQPPSKAGRESRYFGEYVRLQVEDWAEENGYDLYSDGLVIYTTIDSRLQKHAEAAVQEKLVEFQETFENEWTSYNGDYMDELWDKYPGFLRSFIRETDRYKNAFSKLETDQESVVFNHLMADSVFVDSVKRVRTKLQASFTAIKPDNGHILAWVGGADFGTQQYDHVHQSKRQAGSTFKPFVYAVAIDNGYMPYHKFSKYPSSFIQPNGQTWDPKDPTVPSGPQMVPLREALARSLNNVTIRLLPEIAGAPGTNRTRELEPAARMIRDMASNLGINVSDFPAYPSIALGTAEVSLLELVSAYTTFVNKGVHIEPIAITRIEDKEGNVLVEYYPEYSQEAISPETAYMMIDMMRGVIRGGEDYHGTGVRLRNVYNVQQDVAGKTGTTQNSADNWFVAMMPHIVMGSWVGGEDRRIRFPTDNSYSIGQGARTALPIVGQFINNVTDDPEAPWSYDAFEPPPGFVMPEDPANTDQNPERERIGW